MTERYDDSTQQFMNDVTGDPTKSPLKQTVSIAKAVLQGDPKTNLAKMAIRRGIGALAREEFNKTSADKSMPHIVSIFHQLTDKYGREWFDWEPETVIQTLAHDYGMEMGDTGDNIVGALQLILNTNQAHEQWHVFEKVGHAFNDNVVDFSTIQPLRPDEIALTLSIINSIRPKEKYDQEIHAYIAASAKDNGLVYLPVEFFGDESQKFLDAMGNDMTLKANTAQSWSSKVLTSTDAPLDVQLKGLLEIKEYLGAHNGTG